MAIFILTFSVLFFAYGIITKNSKGIPIFYMGFHFYNSNFFIKAKFISHIINFIYSLIIASLLYLRALPYFSIFTIPIVYFISIYTLVKLYEK